ncbi:putative calcium P-type ATPase [Microdochium trichocladiopsis]|uniref:Calcium-transporting ATPase n=1 Tax=Microdochium trichocladiopsis TaxID=1682393 RepID=A0A9P8XX73_9PEZI|nr:putative calcium P-type ATPase [Microdochium trichocladiopsis]KAH7021032.1 putative calcium P-type ATPase [Microdochium trichocladiopsis]
MPESTPHGGDTAPARSRAPTITIDNANDTAPASTTASASPTADRNNTSIDPRANAPIEGKDGRPVSPLNPGTPSIKTGEKAQGFLSVPGEHRSRQNSVDSNDGARSVNFSQGETVVADRTNSHAGPGNDAIMNDPDALKPDQGKEEDFVVENNPFAFTPGELTKMFNPKSLPAFYKLGGLAGIEIGLRSNRESGLSPDERHLDGTVTFEEATARSSKDKVNPAAQSRSGAAAGGSDVPFSDRIRVYRDNRLPEKKGKSFLQLVWITYNDKVLILLSIAAVISLAVGLYQTFGGEHKAGEPAVEWIEGVAIIAAIVIVVLVGSLNDWQKERQFAKLNRKKTDRVVKAIRAGKTVEISVFDILAGEVLHLEPGDLIPVDGLLIQGFNVKCDESQATGESDVIRKRPADEVFAAIEAGEDLKKADPFIQSGGRVMEGVGTFMCTTTGIYSSYGKTLMSLDEDPEVTPLQSKLNVIAEYIAKLGGGAGLLLFIVLFIEFCAHLPQNTGTPSAKGQEFLEIFIVVVTIIVVAVPEGLPLAVTLALAFATTRMLKDNNLVRHLKACEVMGNATTICSDKTGTLTQNKMTVVAGAVGTQRRFGGSETAATEKSAKEFTTQEFASGLAEDTKDLLLKSISLNSTAFEGDVDGVSTFIGSKTETALLMFAREFLAMGAVSEERANVKILQLIPFDSGRKCMGVVAQLENGKARLYVKGASEILLGKCTQLLKSPDQDISSDRLEASDDETIKALIEEYASRSLRTIGLVYRDFESWPPQDARRSEDNKGEALFEDVFKNMCFIGLVGIQDPLRPGVPEAVRECQRAGVIVRMVTGDNKLTARAIAKECGILHDEGIVMEGPTFRNLSKYQQNEIIPRLQVLARSSPEDKRILVRRLKDLGETVAVTGDGTNDAPALKLADVGFSMGIAGTEVAKEASAIILMDDNFTSIVKALKWGRAVNDAVKRFLQFQLTVNVTAVVLTFFTAVANANQESVLTAVQLLWVNLIMDTLAALALATDPPQDSVLDRKPERKGSGIISITMWKMIIGQAIYQLAVTFTLKYAATQLGISNEEPYIDALVFNTFVWMQIFNQWNNRRLDNKFNILEGLTQNWFFIGINVIMCGAQVLIIFFGGIPFSIPTTTAEGRPPQSGPQWGIALICGLLSIPIGMLIRCIPDEFIRKCIPAFIKRRRNRVPGLTVSDEEKFNEYPEVFADVKDDLRFLKKFKGGRVSNLKFAAKHPKEAFMSAVRSPSHSRSNSMREPHTPTQEEHLPSALTPEGRSRSRSTRSRSNSALGATAVMAGIIAGSVGATWSPVDKPAGERDFPPRSTPSPLASRENSQLVSEQQPETGASSDVPTLSVPQPPSQKHIS